MSGGYTLATMSFGRNSATVFSSPIRSVVIQKQVGKKIPCYSTNKPIYLKTILMKIQTHVDSSSRYGIYNFKILRGEIMR